MSPRTGPTPSWRDTFFNSVTRRRVRHRRASTPRSSSPSRRSGARRPTSRRARRRIDVGRARRRAGPAHPRALRVVGALRDAGARLALAAAWSPRTPAASTADRGPHRRARRACRSVFYRNKGAYLVGRLRGERGAGAAGAAAAARRARHRGGRGAHQRRRGEHRVRVQLVVLPGRPRVARRELVGVPALASCRYKRDRRALYTPSATTSTARPSSTATLMRHLEEPTRRASPSPRATRAWSWRCSRCRRSTWCSRSSRTASAPPRTPPARAVMEQYHFVFIHDRVGRLADAQEFEHLEFPGAASPPTCSRTCCAWPGETVLGGRRPRGRAPLLHRAPGDAAQYLPRATPTPTPPARRRFDYGNAIKDLAAADIFTGDMLLKNFGVTRNGRVICLRLRRALPAVRVPRSPHSAAPGLRTSSPPSRGSTSASRTSFRRSSATSSRFRVGWVRTSSNITRHWCSPPSGWPCRSASGPAKWSISSPIRLRGDCGRARGSRVPDDAQRRGCTRGRRALGLPSLFEAFRRYRRFEMPAPPALTWVPIRSIFGSLHFAPNYKWGNEMAGGGGGMVEAEVLDSIQLRPASRTTRDEMVRKAP